MPAPYLISSILASTLLALSILHQAYLWQRKEYRLDRMKAYVTSPEGSITKDIGLLMFSGLVLAGWLAYLTRYTEYVEVFGWSALVVNCIRRVYILVRFGIHRPILTQKSLLLLGLLAASAVGLVLLLLSTPAFPALQLATAIFFFPMIAALAVLTVNGVGGARKKRIIGQASKLRQKHSNVQVVGITGSYGKTSVKEFLLHILQESDVSVRATAQHRNSEFTVAIDMLEQLDDSVGVYIAEMGAYRKGEIKALAKLARPSIGVVTAISNQHAALFGSVEALAAAKWELVRALPKDGMAVLNADNKRVYALGQQETIRKIFCSTEKQADVYAQDIILHEDGISCEVVIDGARKRLNIPLIGEGSLQSAVVAAGVAHALNVPADNIFAALTTLRPLSRTMEVVSGPHGSMIVDDSYSGGEGAAHNAISYLKNVKRSDKRILFVPIIELGSEGAAVHTRIGSMLADSGASILIYGRAYEKNLREGMGSAAQNALWFTSAKELAYAASTGVRADTVVLIEGRVPQVVRSALVR